MDSPQDGKNCTFGICTALTAYDDGRIVRSGLSQAQHQPHMGQQGDAIDKCRMATPWCSWRTRHWQNANARMSSTGIVSQGCASDGTVGSETIQVVLQVLAVGAQDVRQWRSQMVVVVHEQVVGQQLRMTGLGTADWSHQQICRS